jgi:hypothetical protein
MGDLARTREALFEMLARLGCLDAREHGGSDDEDAETRVAPQKPLDLLLIHWPAKAGASPDDASHAAARRDAWHVLERARDLGYVRAIGVSNYTVAHLKEMRDDVENVSEENTGTLTPKKKKSPLREPGGVASAMSAKRAPRAMRRVRRRRRGVLAAGMRRVTVGPEGGAVRGFNREGTTARSRDSRAGAF